MVVVHLYRTWVNILGGESKVSFKESCFEEMAEASDARFPQQICSWMFGQQTPHPLFSYCLKCDFVTRSFDELKFHGGGGARQKWCSCSYDFNWICSCKEIRSSRFAVLKDWTGQEQILLKLKSAESMKNDARGNSFFSVCWKWLLVKNIFKKRRRQKTLTTEFCRSISIAD